MQSRKMAECNTTRAKVTSRETSCALLYNDRVSGLYNAITKRARVRDSSKYFRVLQRMRPEVGGGSVAGGGNRRGAKTSSVAPRSLSRYFLFIVEVLA